MPSDRPAPCPFCGGLSQAVPSLSPPSSVTCTRCRARIDADDIGTAIERWNRRDGACATRAGGGVGP